MWASLSSEVCLQRFLQALSVPRAHSGSAMIVCPAPPWDVIAKGWGYHALQSPWCPGWGCCPQPLARWQRSSPPLWTCTRCCSPRWWGAAGDKRKGQYQNQGEINSGSQLAQTPSCEQCLTGRGVSHCSKCFLRYSSIELQPIIVWNSQQTTISSCRVSAIESSVVHTPSSAAVFAVQNPTSIWK